MKFKSTFIALSVSALLCSGMASAAITGTGSVKMTFQTKVVSGTCTAKVLNGAGTASTEIAFGDVYKSDLVNKTRVEPLKIRFTNCSGVAKATVAAAKGAGGECSGTAKNGDSFSGGLLMSCNTPPAAQEVTITDGAGEFPMNSRIVVGQGQTIADVGTGAVTAPVTFTVTYQ